jgi:uncharacterized integral membrane protein (TIGR00698 family)
MAAKKAAFSGLIRHLTPNWKSLYMGRTCMSQPDYSWAEYLDYMEGGGSDVLNLPASKADRLTPLIRKDHPIRGILAAMVVTVAAMLLSSLPFWPFTVAGRHPIEPVMLAIVLGMALSNTWSAPRTWQPGIKFSVKKLLPFGIVLLGARLNFKDLVQVGLEGLVLSVLETAVALALLLGLTRVLKLPQKLGILLGVGTAICGGTAIVATAPVIEAEEKDVVFSVATVTLLGLIGMFLLPILGQLLNLSQKEFGVWAGLAIHQTPQVVAAGFAYGSEAGSTATIVKLARVCLLAPVVFLIGLGYARQKAGSGTPGTGKRLNYLHLIPTFVVGFLAMALLKTLGLLPELTFHVTPVLFRASDHHFSLAELAEQVSKICITISMAAVGLETRFASMKQTGLRPFVASLAAVIVVAGLILALIKFNGV